MDFAGIFSEEETKIIADEFRRLNSLTYLDHAGSCLYPQSLIEAVTKDLCVNTYSNPHSNNTCSKTTNDKIDQVRYRILEHFNTDQNEYDIIFTSGATASLKLVAEAFNWSPYDPVDENEWHPQAFDSKQVVDKGDFVYLNDSHTSVLGMRTIAEEKGVSVTCLTKDEAFNAFNNGFSVTRKPTDKLCSNSLFVYPAQCNFSGLKYPLDWTEKTKNGSLSSVLNRKNTNWYCLLDAATYLATSPLDLNLYKPDFVCLSFYKIFGYPTGLGALIVRKCSASVLLKKYYGGGTVLIALSDKNYFVPRPLLHEKFEDGSLNFLSILSLHQGFNVMEKLVKCMDRVSRHSFLLAKYAFESLLRLHHSNGFPAVEIYTDTCYDDINFQGGIISFNLLRSNGEYVGFVEVLHQANLHKIQLRTGCFCNSGACWRHLNLSSQDVKSHYKAGHVCGDDMDLVNGQPTGAVRISFGYYTNHLHVNRFLDMIENCFVDQPSIKKLSEHWAEKSSTIKERLKCNKIVANGKKSTNSVSLSQSSVVHSNVILKDVEKLENLSSVVELKMSSEPVLSHIFLYPVKSCGALSVSTWKLDSKGLVYDRTWMIIDSSGVALTQKKEPKMCLVKPTIDFENKKLVLHFKDQMCSVDLDIGEDLQEWNGTFCQSKVCGDRIKGFDCGDGVASWLSGIFDNPGLRLIRQHSRSSKKSDLSLANLGQYLLVSKTSALWLSNEIASSEFNKDTFIDRFRSNFVIENICEPFSELNWSKVTIGDSEFKVDGSCNRCQMICIDQSSGETNREPLTVLGAAMKGKLKFGIYLTKINQGIVSLAIGNRVTFV